MFLRLFLHRPVGNGVLDVPQIRTAPDISHHPVGDGVLDVPLSDAHPGTIAPVGEGLAPPEKADDPAPLYEVAQIVRESSADTAGPPRTSAPTAGYDVPAFDAPCAGARQRDGVLDIPLYVPHPGIPVLP